MPLSYLRDDCHKQAVTHIQESRRFKSMYTLQGKPFRHATRFAHLVHVWSRTIRISRGPHIATFCTFVNRFEQIHCSREDGLPTQPSARLSDPWVHTQLLYRAHHWSSGEKPSFCWHLNTRLAGPINTSMRLVCSILARRGQTIGP
jgi:hypothetical protein